MKKLIILIFLSFYACHKSSIYPVTGVIKKIKHDEHKLTIDHDKIDGFMDPMVMDFPIHKSIDLNIFNINDSVKFILNVNETKSYSYNFKILGKSTTLNSDDWMQDESESLDIGDVISDVTFLDINEKSYSISESDGKLRFITFIFSKCPMPNMCPALNIKTAFLADKFSETSNIEFLTISFDYIYDTPTILNDIYGERYSNYNNWKFLSSVKNKEDLFQITNELGLAFWGVEENNIGHNMRAVLINSNKKILKIYSGDKWNVKDVADDINFFFSIN